MATPPLKSRLKQTPTDVWSIRERLCLASSVLRSGDQNWVSVSRTIKSFSEPSRPGDWFSQKNCALQYSDLLEHVDTPKRKRGDRGEIETPGEAIVRKLTQERVNELKAKTEEHRQKYKKLKLDIEYTKNGHFDDRLEAMLQECHESDKKPVVIEEPISETRSQVPEGRMAVPKSPKMPATPVAKSKISKLSLRARRSSSQSEPGSESESAVDSPMDISKPCVVEDQQPSIVKEEIVVPAEDSERTIATESVLPNPQPPVPTSPLLTSLLKNPISSTGFPGLHTFPPIESPVITNTQNEKPEISESSATVPPIAHVSLSPTVKTEPVQASTVESTTEAITIQEPSVSISDIPIAVAEKTSVESSISEVENVKTEEEKVVSETVVVQEEVSLPVEEQDLLTTEIQEVKKEIEEVVHSTTTQKIGPSNDETLVDEATIDCSSPAKVEAWELTSEQVEEAAKESSEPEFVACDDGGVVEVEVDTHGEQEIEVTSVIETEEVEETVVETSAVKEEEEVVEDEKPPQKDLPVQKEKPLEQPVQDDTPGPIETPVIPVEDVTPVPTYEEPVIPTVKSVEPTRGTRGKRGRGSRRSVVQQHIPPNTDSLHDDTSKLSEANEKSESCADREATETPEERTPVNEEKEPEPVKPPEERVRGRKRKDDSKRKESLEEEKGEREVKSREHRWSERRHHADEERGRRRQSSSSETKALRSGKGKDQVMLATPSDDDEERGLVKSGLFPLDSVPNSPASVSHSDDPDSVRDYKLWKKAIMLVWRSAATHKYANVFLHPVTEEVAPGYSSVVYRSMDLSTIKKNIENGLIKTTAEFQRDMMLMFQNAIMYNSSDHDVFHMAVEMQKEVEKHIQDFLATQLMVQAAEMPKNLRRETRELSQKRTTEQRSDRGQNEDYKRSYTSLEGDGTKLKKKRRSAVDD